MSSRLVIALFLVALVGVSNAQSVDGYPTIYDREIKTFPEIGMPVEAELSGLGGTVSVPVVVDANGNVVIVGKAVGPGYVCPDVDRKDVVAMRNAAMNAAKFAKFAATSAGQPEMAVSWIWVEFLATDKPAEVTSSRTLPAIKTDVNQANKAATSYSNTGKVRYRSANSLLTNYLNTVSREPESPYSLALTKDETKAISFPSDIPTFLHLGYKTGGRKMSGGVLNGKALSLGVPPYPLAARMVKASGTLFVHVLIDTNGKIFSATPTSGHPLLRPSTIAAACKSRFAPISLDDQPAMMYGVITYHFVL